MNVSNCCGAEVKTEYQSDFPHVYDDEYNLRTPIPICGKCGKVLTNQKENGHAAAKNTDSE